MEVMARRYPQDFSQGHRSGSQSGSQFRVAVQVPRVEFELVMAKITVWVRTSLQGKLAVRDVFRIP